MGNLKKTLFDFVFPTGQDAEGVSLVDKVFVDRSRTKYFVNSFSGRENYVIRDFGVKKLKGVDSDSKDVLFYHLRDRYLPDLTKEEVTSLAQLTKRD